MLHPPADARRAHDKALSDEAVRQSSERLVTHERLARQRVGRPAGVAVDRAQRIPLRQGRAHGSQGSIGLEEVPVLSSLDGAAELLGGVHVSMLSQLVYI